MSSPTPRRVSRAPEPEAGGGRARTRQPLPGLATRLLLVALALAIAGGALWHYRELVRVKRELTGELHATGLENSRPDVVESLRREPDPLKAQMLVARALLAETLAAPSPEVSPQQLQTRQLDLLARARRLADARLRTQPSSWEARFVLGSSLYLERSVLQDDRLLTEYREWEAPLEQARRLAPNEPDPQRFLTMAYLEIWPMLSPAKRDLARSMLVTAFADRRVFELFIEPWLLVAGDSVEALDPLPSEPFVWDGVTRIFLRDRKWELAAEARRRGIDALDRHLRDQLAEGEARLAGGDFRHAQDRFLYVLPLVPFDVRSVPLLTRTLELLAPGPVAPGVAQVARRWLDWHLERCLYQSCLFPETTQERLQQMAGELDPATLARSRLAASDLFAAQQIETSAVISEDWSRYWLQKAAAQLTRGETASAGESLDRVRGELRSETLFSWQASRVAEAALAGSGGADGTVGPSPSESASRVSKGSWSEYEWQQAPHRAPKLVLWPASSSPRLQLEFPGALGQGGVVDLVWDGASIGHFVIDPTEPRFAVAIEVSPDLHLLELRFLGGSTRVPARVQLGEAR